MDSHSQRLVLKGSISGCRIGVSGVPLAEQVPEISFRRETNVFAA